MTPTEPQAAIFESGPFPHIQRSLGLFRPVARAVGARALMIILLGWFPLAVLTLADAFSSSGSTTSFLKDIGTHARSLIAAPLFVVCEAICLQRLQVIAYHFREARLIRAEEVPAFQRLIAKCRSLLNSTLLEALAIVAAYLIVLLILRYVPVRVMPAWFALNGTSHLMSWAGWWYTVVSFPLLLILVFSWLLRVLIWGWFLFKVSRMNLRLIPSHPDHAAGLRFLNAQLFALMPVALTFGIIGAGAVANRIAYHGGGVNELKRTVIGLVVFVLIVFVGPLLVFGYNLHKQKVSGIYRYGLLADSVGRQFERKWLANYGKVNSESLEVPDFSATTDLYQIVDNVHQISLVPFELRTVLSLCIAALLPFIPVLLMLVPLTVVLKEVASLLFGIG